MKIPTAEDFFNKYNVTKYASITDVMREFAKLHVQEALKAADENAQVTVVDYNDGGFNSAPDPIYSVDSDSILNAYPLENIK